MRSGNDILVLGRTTARSDHKLFGIKQPDRLSHVYIVGKTGTGKSTLIERMIRQDIAAGRGAALIDPHGDLAERVARWAMPRRRDIVYLDLGDDQLTLGYNPLLHVRAELRSLVASGVIDLFKMLWSDAWGVRMEHILRNAILALLEQPRASLADILPMLTEKSFRARIAATLQNEQVRHFWQKEFSSYSLRYQADGIAPIQNKVGSFLADPRLRRFLTPDDRGLRLRSIMDDGQVLIVGLPQGKIGADSAHLLGGLLVTALGSAAFSRAFETEQSRRPFFIYVDEFESFSTLSFALMLAELRKFRVGMVLGHQHLGQLNREVLDGVLGNAGTLIAFRLSAADATVIAAELGHGYKPADLVMLRNFEFAVRLLIDGAVSKPFSAKLPLS